MEIKLTSYSDPFHVTERSRIFLYGHNIRFTDPDLSVKVNYSGIDVTTNCVELSPWLFDILLKEGLIQEVSLKEEKHVFLSNEDTKCYKFTSKGVSNEVVFSA